MKKMKNILLMLLGFFIIFIMCLLIKLFIIGRLMPINKISIDKVEVNTSSVDINGDIIIDSASSFGYYKYRINNGVMYIKIYGTLVSSMHKYSEFNINIKNDGYNIDAIYVEDADNNIPIWQRK